MAFPANSIDLQLNQLFPQTMLSLTTGMNNVRQAVRPLAFNSLIQYLEAEFFNFQSLMLKHN